MLFQQTKGLVKALCYPLPNTSEWADSWIFLCVSSCGDAAILSLEDAGLWQLQSSQPQLLHRCASRLAFHSSPTTHLRTPTFTSWLVSGHSHRKARLEISIYLSGALSPYWWPSLQPSLSDWETIFHAQFSSNNCGHSSHFLENGIAPSSWKIKERKSVLKLEADL